MLKKTSIILLLGIFLSSCVKRDNDLDCLSKNFENNSFLIESATVINPDTIPNPGSYPYTSRGSVDLKLKINKINSGLEYNIGLCWDTSINPVISGNNYETAGPNESGLGKSGGFITGLITGVEDWSDDKDVCFEINCKFSPWSPQYPWYQYYLKPNTTYYFRYFIYIPNQIAIRGSYGSKTPDTECKFSDPITKYSDNFKIIIP